MHFFSFLLIIQVGMDVNNINGADNGEYSYELLVVRHSTKYRQ